MQQFPLMFRIMLLFLCLLGIMTIPYSVFGYAIRKHSIFLLHRPSIIINYTSATPKQWPNLELKKCEEEKEEEEIVGPINIAAGLFHCQNALVSRE